MDEIGSNRCRCSVTIRRIAGLAAAAVTAGSALLGSPIPSASAQPCPDVDVVFARGTGEPPRVGGVGQASAPYQRQRQRGGEFGAIKLALGLRRRPIPR